MKDIVIDSCVMHLYDKPKDKAILELFEWTFSKGVLCVSLPLLHEYNRQGNPLVSGLIDHLMRHKRFTRIDNAALKAFAADKHYKYTCNSADRKHARLVFSSTRKRLVSNDEKLVNDVNKFPRVDGVQPSAVKRPDASFFI